MNIIEELIKISDKEYAKFSSKLTPNIGPALFLGVRVPDLRKFAKTISNKDEGNNFLKSLPHKYFDENMLHSLLLNDVKDFNELIKLLDEFIPYINNWAVNDIIKPKVFLKHKKELVPHILRWINSEKPYSIRFGVSMLMGYSLDDDFNVQYLEEVSKIRSNEYYVNMMIAWFFATALAKKYDETIPYIENRKLDIWTHNKTIQKAIESYRISDEAKTYLRSLKQKNHD